MYKVLLLASWYPGRVDFLNGDFIERHAKAIALKHDVTVIFVVKDPQLRNKKYDLEYLENEKVKVYKGYYREYQSKFAILSKAVSLFRYLKCTHKLFNLIVRKQGKPDLIHLYIPIRAGIYALYLKIFKKLKYIISEQHSWYMPSSGGYEKSNRITKLFIKSIFRNASAVHTPSEALGRILLEKNIFKGNFYVIPNVVNNTIFYPVTNVANSFNPRFVTITGNVYHKNTDGIIRAFKKVSDQEIDFVLDIVGPYVEDLKTLSEKSELSDKINFYGAVSYEDVAKINQKADAMIFFTRYETFGCVIIEANACGLPVIVSDLPVIRENVTANFNGIFVNPEDEEDLTQKIIWYINHKNEFDKQKIALSAKDKFSYETISRQFDKLYKEVLQENTSSQAK